MKATTSALRIFKNLALTYLVTTLIFGNFAAADKIKSYHDSAAQKQMTSKSLVDIVKERKAREKTRKELSAREYLVEAGAKQRHDNQVQFMNYVDEPTREQIEDRKFVNLENARARGEQIMEERIHPTAVKVQVNSDVREQGLMSSFKNSNKKKAKSPKLAKDQTKEDLRAKLAKKKEYDREQAKKGKGNSNIYKSQANSLSGAFK